MVLIWDITHHIKPVTERSHIIPIQKASEADEPLLWNIYGVHMVLIWDITHHIKPVTERSHIIPIEKASEADEPLLWNIYGPCMGHNLPYQTHTFSLVRAC